MKPFKSEESLYIVGRMVKNSQMPAIDFGATVPLGGLICACTLDKLEKTVAM